jgi:aspartyl-tRNA(Asn)/glutamyl-tRNA(Gln) amidotransferase subunit A
MSVIRGLAHSIRQQPGGCRRLVELCLERMAEFDSPECESPLNSISKVLNARARAIADRLDEELTAGHDRGWLHGIPFGIKELFDVAGSVTTAGCPAYARRQSVATADSLVVARLVEAGAIPVAKTHTNDLAYGLDGRNHYYGDTRNAWNRDRIAGGSSGGSATAVCAGLLPLALGTDTGGSIRVPCAYQGIAGIRATHGQEMRGLVPLSPAFDTVGPIAREAEDVAIAHAVLQGNSSLTWGTELPTLHVRGKVFGAIGDAGLDRLPDATADVYDASLRTLIRAGASLERVNLPGLAAESALHAFTVIQTVQALAAHRQLLEEPDLDPNTRDRMTRGYQFSALEYVEALHLQEQLAREVRSALGNCDALLAPVTPLPAPLLSPREAPAKPTEIESEVGILRLFPDEEPTPPQATELELRTDILRLNVIGGLSGLPIAAVPAGLYDGLPLGWQLVGGAGQDWDLLLLAAAVQRTLDVPFAPQVSQSWKDF